MAWGQFLTIVGQVLLSVFALVLIVVLIAAAIGTARNLLPRKDPK